MSANFILYVLPSIIIALTIHEAAHALTSYLLGDPTAKQEGRISLNPIRHLDLYGSLLFLIAGFGWGKPVPVNPHYFTNPKRDQALTALAGPASNFLLAAILAIPLKFVAVELGTVPLFFLQTLFEINILLCAFNLIPIPPLDGSKILAIFIPKSKYYQYEEFLQANLSYIIILVFADLYLFSSWFGFSVVRTILDFMVTLLKTIIFLGT
jgi:Zn-dependent protease